MLSGKEGSTARLPTTMLALGGLLLLPSAFIPSGSFAAFVSIQMTLLVGFALLLSYSVIEVRMKPGTPTCLALVGVAVQALGWSWPFHLGLFFFVPYGLFGVISGVTFAVAAAAARVEHDRPLALRSGLFCGGALLFSVIAFTNVIFTPQFVFAPLAIAAIIAAFAGRHQPRYSINRENVP